MANKQITTSNWKSCTDELLDLKPLPYWCLVRPLPPSTSTPGDLCGWLQSVCFAACCVAPSVIDHIFYENDVEAKPVIGAALCVSLFCFFYYFFSCSVCLIYVPAHSRGGWFREAISKAPVEENTWRSGCLASRGQCCSTDELEGNSPLSVILPSLCSLLASISCFRDFRGWRSDCRVHF